MPLTAENRKRYPKDWSTRSRFIRFYRAKNRCEFCHAQNYQPHPITGKKVILTCAHLHDKRPEVANLLNLVALCQKCHLDHDRQDNIATRRRRRYKDQMTLNFES